MDEDKLYATAAYIFFVPALYIIFTKLRRRKFTAFHAAQALLLWITIFAVLVLLKFLLNLIWSWAYLPWLDFLGSLFKYSLFVYAFYCGAQTSLGEKYEIPWISKVAEALC